MMAVPLYILGPLMLSTTVSLSAYDRVHRGDSESRLVRHKFDLPVVVIWHLPGVGNRSGLTRLRYEDGSCKTEWPYIPGAFLTLRICEIDYFRTYGPYRWWIAVAADSTGPIELRPSAYHWGEFFYITTATPNEAYHAAK